MPFKCLPVLFLAFWLKLVTCNISQMANSTRNLIHLCFFAFFALLDTSPAWQRSRRRLHLCLSLLVCLLVWANVFLLQSLPMLALQVSSPQYSFAPGKKITLNDNAFLSGSFVLEPSVRDQLSFVARQLKALPSLKIEVSGHTDSEGDAAQNLQLSYKRAEIVRGYLIALDVAPERIIARGYGDMQPLVTDNTINAQRQNRRVDIVGLSGTTERALTSPKGAPLDPEAKLTLVQNRVLTLAPWELDWVEAVFLQPIYELHKIQTGKDSRAIIKFTDQGSLQVAENSVVVMYRSQERFTNQIPSGGQTGDIGLMKGGLWMKLKSLKATEPVVIRTPSSEIRMQQSAIIGSDAEGRSLVSVHEGTADVATLVGNIASGSTFVQENFGTRINSGAPPEKPRPLPPAPVLDYPSDSVAESSSVVRFSWSADAPKTRLDVTDAASQRVVFSKITSEQSLDVPLPSGKYTFFVSALDSIGLESKRIGRPLEVVPVRTLRFRFFEYVTMVAAVLLVWYGFVFGGRWAKWTALALALVSVALLVLR
jgi:hypothetical protein